MFIEVEEHHRVALFALSVLCIPPSPLTNQWSRRFLSCSRKELDINDDYFEAYRTFTPHKFSNEPNNDIFPVFIDLLSSTNFIHIDTITKFSFLLLKNELLTSRGQVFLRNLASLFRIPPKDFLSLECALTFQLSDIEDNLSRKAQTNNGPNYARYAKIGVASIGAGALLAFTGGLAAPAVAAAYLALGGSAVAAATLTSATALASLFGTAGAGLAGYKMVRSSDSYNTIDYW
jgi:hypothetical protein